MYFRLTKHHSVITVQCLSYLERALVCLRKIYLFQMEASLRNLKLAGHVGFDSLPDQLVSKSVQNGFLFNIMCIGKSVIKFCFNIFQPVYILGETGLGKSTLMDSLFNTNFESSPSPHTLPTVKLKAHTYELQESNVRLKVGLTLTVFILCQKWVVDILTRKKIKLKT